MSEKGTDALPISKESGIERAVDILLEEIIMTSVLSSLSFSLLSVIQSFMSSMQGCSSKPQSILVIQYVYDFFQTEEVQ